MIHFKKKLFVLILLLNTFCNNTKAQETYLDLLINYTPTNFNFGKENADFKEYKKGLWGFQGGVSMQLGITSYFSLVPELYYFNKGVKLAQNNPLTITETKIRLNTLELPILSRFHYKQVYFNLGPSFAYNLSGKIKTEGDDNIAKETIKISFKNTTNGFKRWDLGLQFGLGYEIKLKNKSRISLDARYHYGISNISQNNEIYNRYFYMTFLWSKPWKNNPFIKNKTK